MSSKLKLEYREADLGDLERLVSLRIDAMRPSLIALNRFDPVRARERFSNSYIPNRTTKIYLSDEFVGFYVLIENEDHICIDHLYVDPRYQGSGIGALILDRIKNKAISNNIPIKLGALKKSPSNIFYKRHGFVKTHEEEWDNYYIWENS